MKRSFIILAIMMAMTLVSVPVSAQEHGRGHGRGHGNDAVRWRQGRHHGWSHKKDDHGYRNYGQYRRTQVGNRRFRTVKRYYWSDGTRLSRLVRVYY